MGLVLAPNSLSYDIVSKAQSFKTEEYTEIYYQTVQPPSTRMVWPVM